MCRKVEPLKVGPNEPNLAYAGTKPVNQSLVTQTDGMIVLLQQYSRQALPKIASCLTVAAAFISAYGTGKISAW